MLAVAFVVVPALTAPPPAAPAPCDPHPAPAAADPFALDPFGTPFPTQMDTFDHNNTAWVVYELNTGKIKSAGVIGPNASPPPDVQYEPAVLQGEADGFGVATRANEHVLNITDDPKRDALFESFMCGTEGDVPWRVDPWSARGVLA